jgi:hypothetical protein
MAKRFLTPLKLANLTSNPQSGSNGEIYFNETDNNIKVFSNSAWNVISGGTPIIQYNSIFPLTPESGQLFFHTEFLTLNIYISGTWLEVGSVPPEIEAGTSFTTVFTTFIDGGDSGSTSDIAFDGGTSQPFYSSLDLLA